jgi:hypothetical protein
VAVIQFMLIQECILDFNFTVLSTYISLYGNAELSDVVKNVFIRAGHNSYRT